MVCIGPKMEAETVRNTRVIASVARVSDERSPVPHRARRVLMGDFRGLGIFDNQ
jgi:hypothetical protein